MEVGVRLQTDGPAPTAIFVALAAAWLFAVGCESRRAPGQASPSGDLGSPVANAEGSLTRTASVPLPGGPPGIGFDDLRFSAALGRVLVPAGRSGRIDLVDPASREVTAIGGFSEQRKYSGGHDDGVTSVDDGPGVLYATDRTSGRLAVVDPAAESVVKSVALAAHPDYVRYVAPTREVWVTEPDADQLEVFTAGDDGRDPQHAAIIEVRGGPESLVIDADNGRAYTHLWRGETVAIDLRSRAIVARWKNGCRSSRGIALDAEHRLLITACAEGKATVLDLRDGHRVSEITTGSGVDLVAFDARTRHVYVPSGRKATLVVAALEPTGRLTEIGHVATVPGAHCVTTDGAGNAYVCDAAHGQLLVFHDTLVALDGDAAR